MTPLRLSTYAQAQEALKHADLAQALYDDALHVMADALVTLHGADHAQRRAVEFAVFNRRFFRTYETESFPQTLEPLLQPCLQSGGCDVVALGYQVTMNLTADFAGIDRRLNNAGETATLLRLVKTFSAGATLAHATGPHEPINAAVDAAMEEFDELFLRPSVERRRQYMASAKPLPNDVLSQLLTHDQTADLPWDVLRREMAFYLQAGAHSTANSATHALNEIFNWVQSPAHAHGLEPDIVQRCVHESLRLHPASPVARRKALQALEICGHRVCKGQRVVIDLEAANRDAQVFGADAHRFNPERSLPARVWPFGLSFGYGIHACLGRDLDGGVVPKPGQPAVHLGIVSLFVCELLAHRARPSLEDAPVLDAGTRRSHWGYYPIQFEGVT